MYAGGFHGWAQLVADGVKFAQKEDVVPAAADRPVFQLAPAVALLPYLLVLVAIPLGPGPGRRRTLDLGLFFVLAVMGVGVLGSLMAGWAQREQVLAARRPAHRRAADGLRAAAASSPPRRVAMAAGHAVADRHRRRRGSRWWLPWQALGAGGVLRRRRWPSCTARRSTCRSPTPRSSSAPYTEYTGLRFALFLLAEYAGIVVFCALTTVLFLGGWHGPVRPSSLGWLWTLVKMFAVAFVVIWLRVSYPRLREDQLQRLAWQVLVPLALAQLALTGVVRVVIGMSDVATERAALRRRPGQGPGVTLRDDDPALGHRAVPGRRSPSCRRAAAGVIALLEENCTVCMLCARECPDWCIYIDSHKEAVPAARRGRARPHPQRARPVRHRLLAVHVLRHLHRGLPVRRAVLVAGVRVRRARHPRPDPRAGPARRVDVDGARRRPPLDPAAEEPKEVAAAPKAAAADGRRADEAEPRDEPPDATGRTA